MAHPTGNAASIAQHAIEIQRNRISWEKKPALQEVYRGYHRMLAAKLDPSVPGIVVELGSGMGAIKEVIPQCVTTDLFANPWLDRQENAYRLSFPTGSVSHLILFDVWHHLRYPGTALAEFRRVLGPGGRVIVFDPAVSAVSRWMYGLFHHEPLGLDDPITWQAPTGFFPEDADYFAAQGAATRIFWRREWPGSLSGWAVVEVTPMPAFEYFSTGGFSGPQLPFRSAWRKLDNWASRWPNLFAARLLVVLKKMENQ